MRFVATGLLDFGEVARGLSGMALNEIPVPACFAINMH
jgi:hypothetical protein